MEPNGASAAKMLGRLNPFVPKGFSNPAVSCNSLIENGINMETLEGE